MEIDFFIEGLAKHVFTNTSEQQINKETSFMELEDWNSMTAFSLISYIDESFGKKITLPELLQSQTIEDLFLIVNS